MDPSLIVGALLGAGMVGFLLFIRSQDLPKPEPVSPFKHLDERKAAIYENLRDLQFEYRVNKLSDGDYQTTKLELQKELARVLAEVDRIKGELAADAAQAPPASQSRAAQAPLASQSRTAQAPPASQSRGAQPPPASEPRAANNVCPACGAEFEKALKFCGECGKPMGATS